MEPGTTFGINLGLSVEPDSRFIGQHVANIERFADIPIGVAPATDNIGLATSCIPAQNGHFYYLVGLGKMTIARGTFDVTLDTAPNSEGEGAVFYQFNDPACSQVNSITQVIFQSNVATWSKLPGPGQFTVAGVDGADDGCTFINNINSANGGCPNLWSNLDPGETNFFPTSELTLSSASGSVVLVLAPEVTPITGTFQGNLTVTTMTVITGGTVTGNVQQKGGSLVTNNATIDGNLQIISSGSDQICGSTVGGNLQVHNNDAPITIGDPSIDCQGNTIGGNLQINNDAAVQVFDDMVTGNLQCQNNTSITGDMDTAKLLQGQCAGF